MADIVETLDSWNEYSRALEQLKKDFDLILSRAVTLRPTRKPVFDKDQNQKIDENNQPVFEEVFPAHPYLGHTMTQEEATDILGQIGGKLLAKVKEIQSLSLETGQQKTT